MKKNLIATKPLKYGTRRLMPGDPFEASARDARLLIAVKKAREGDARETAELPPIPPALKKKVSTPLVDEPLTALRTEYKAIVGRAAYHGWGVDDLKQRIADARAKSAE